jgi:hypothetical protein
VERQIGTLDIVDPNQNLHLEFLTMGCCESSNRRKVDDLNPIMGTVSSYFVRSIMQENSNQTSDHFLCEHIQDYTRSTCSTYE